MQVFMPFPDPIVSLACLDDKRLLKQIVEAQQILWGQTGHKNHPAVLLWQQYPDFLKLYLYVGVKIWKWRGYVNRGKDYKYKNEFDAPLTYRLPPFFYHVAYHDSHQLSLIKKSEEYSWLQLYRFYNNDDDFGYLWPCVEGERLSFFRIVSNNKKTRLSYSFPILWKYGFGHWQQYKRDIYNYLKPFIPPDLRRFD